MINTHKTQNVLMDIKFIVAKPLSLQPWIIIMLLNIKIRNNPLLQKNKNVVHLIAFFVIFKIILLQVKQYN